MSLPRELLDQLLSGYLDDALSDDERDRVEQLLQDDPEVARELQELTQLGGTLREIYHVDQARQLQPGFADRVLKATVDQGATEGLSEEHPVMMLAQQPSTGLTPPTLPVRRIAGVLVALAASTIVAIAVLRTPDPAPVEGELVNDSPRVDVDPEIAPPERRPLEQETPPGTSPIEQIANDIKPNDLAPPSPESRDLVEMPTEDPQPVVDKVANKTVPPSELSAEEIRAQALKMLHNNVMVVDVRQTEKGRQSNAVANAMAQAGLQATNEKQINEEIVGFGKGLSQADDSVSVLYLEGPATKLDNFMNRMVLDFDGIEAIGFKMVSDAPIVGVADALARKKMTPDTIRSIRHDVSWRLADDAGNSVQILAGELASQKFKPITRKGKPGLADLIAGGDHDGMDVKSRIFVLVR
jgi:hypothetical protein